MEVSITRVVHYGYLGVDLFAFLSGFIICYTYGNKLSQYSLRETSNFIWLRFIRIYPLHLFILGIFVALYFTYNSSPSLYSLKYNPQLINQLFMLNGWGLEDKFSWNVPSWTLSSEWLCYLIFPIVAPFIARTDPVRAIFMIVLLLSATVITLDYLGIKGFEASLRGGIVRIAGEFFSGCFLYRIYQGGLLNKFPMGWIGLIALSIAIATVMYHPSLSSKMIIPVEYTVISFAILVLALAYNSAVMNLLFGNRLSVYLGEISYSMYLFHWVVVSHLEEFGLMKLPILERMGAYTLIVIVCSMACYHLVENPSRKILRKVYISDNFLPMWLRKKYVKATASSESFEST